MSGFRMSDIPQAGGGGAPPRWPTSSTCCTLLRAALRLRPSVCRGRCCCRRGAAEPACSCRFPAERRQSSKPRRSHPASLAHRGQCRGQHQPAVVPIDIDLGPFGPLYPSIHGGMVAQSPLLFCCCPPMRPPDAREPVLCPKLRPPPCATRSARSPPAAPKPARPPPRRSPPPPAPQKSAAAG